jgi:hypothetical protein
MDKHGSVGPEMPFGLATGLAEALTVIHAAGIMHRDLKPSNVLLTRSGPKVIDFGIAHTFEATSLTMAGMTVGSAGFMAPEQVMGHAGTAADIFCWALSIAYAASGRSPFGAGAPDAIMFRILNAEPDISAVPERIRPQVVSALAKDPHNRPSARDLLAKLTDTTSPNRGINATQTILSETWRPPRPSPGQGGASAGAAWWQAKPGQGASAQQQQPQSQQRPQQPQTPSWQQAATAGQQPPQSTQGQQQHPSYHQATLGPEEAAQALRQAQQLQAQQAAARQSAQQYSPPAQLPARPPARRRVGIITAAVILAFVLAAAGTLIGLELSGQFKHNSTNGTGGTPTASASATGTATGGQAAALPVFVVGSYSGMKPTMIAYSGDATNVVTGISWGSWTASGATGEGTSDIDSCNPNCAQASPDYVITKITLSDPANGQFTKMTETRNGSTTSFTYPSDWAQNAS